MPKLSVYVPDVLWTAALSLSDSSAPSHIIQAALAQYVSERMTPDMRRQAAVEFVRLQMGDEYANALEQQR